MNKTVELMKDIGQAPIVVKKEVNGFIFNRLQYAIMMEAWRLVEVCINPITPTIFINMYILLTLSIYKGLIHVVRIKELIFNSTKFVHNYAIWSCAAQYFTILGLHVTKMAQLACMPKH